MLEVFVAGVCMRLCRENSILPLQTRKGGWPDDPGLFDTCLERMHESSRAWAQRVSTLRCKPSEKYWSLGPGETGFDEV